MTQPTVQQQEFAQAMDFVAEHFKNDLLWINTYGKKVTLARFLVAGAKHLQDSGAAPLLSPQEVIHSARPTQE